MSLPEDDAAGRLPGEGLDGTALRVVSLNLGGRNTNPVEFELKGDNSEMAAEAVAILRRAGKAMKSAQEGPLLIPAPEMEAVHEILSEIFRDSAEEAQSEWYSRIRDLLRCETWAQVLANVRETSPHLFNAFNLYTLKLNRPTVWENPVSCKEFSHTEEYLAAWRLWYRSLDREGRFWLEDAPRVANKRGLDVPGALAGLLLFDLMCLCTARCSMRPAGEGDDFAFAEDTRDVPFKEIARFAAELPASSLAARHAAAQRIAQGAHALLAQEARSFASHPTIAKDFLPPFSAHDGFTAIFLRRDSFHKASDISAPVLAALERCIDGEASPELERAWRTSASRLAAAYCECQPQLGGFRVCFVSLHASKSDYTADFLEKLREALGDYDADINVVGMDSNCTSPEVSAFQKRLWNAGFDIGCAPNQQQVTVAKQRTPFQTQAQKVGAVDISHKDYILTWTSPRVRRGLTGYTPDLRTSYGVEQETKQCVRLPTTEWPFDHCSVATSFHRRATLKESIRCSRRSCCPIALAMLILLVMASPLLSGERDSPYGPPGMWFHDGLLGELRPGICEAPAPCPEGWLQDGGSCYKTTPKLGFLAVQELCAELGAEAVTIGSEAENQLLLRRSLCPVGEFCYIGLLGDFAGRSYWSSGAPLNYTQLVPLDPSGFPIFENSRGTEFYATVLANMPAVATGCDVGYSVFFLGGNGVLGDVLREFVVPVLAMVWSGVLLAYPRPAKQRLAFKVLLLAFIVNFLMAAQKMVLGCFSDDFDVSVSLVAANYMTSALGATFSSALGLWMVVRRMSVLYTSSTFKGLFWASVVSSGLFFVNFVAFLDPTVPFAITWAVLLGMAIAAVNCLLYVAIGLRATRRLYRTWSCLQKEATSGCSTRGTTLAALVRAARFHLIAVPLSIMTGAGRWAMLGSMIAASTSPSFTYGLSNTLFVLCNLLDSVTNDFCTHVLAAMDMDESVLRAKGVTVEVAERAEREVEQHQLAVQMLKAAPTSCEQLHQFATLESKAIAALGSEHEVGSFLMLKSAVRVETARIHRLMYCVRLRAMTMQLRYQFLLDVQTIEGTPRQHVPEEFAMGEKSEAAAQRYLTWMYSVADGAQQALFQKMQHLLAKFNGTAWPSDLGLAPEEFPWRIWAGQSDHSVGTKRLRKDEVISPGSTLIHSPPRGGCLARGEPPALCTVLEQSSPERAWIQRSGRGSVEQIPLDDLRRCSGGGVFLPGPQKKKQRSLDKIAADYKESAAWPAAASVVDVCRCMILCDDPYAMAVFVAYLRKNMEVLRVKNRFSEDLLESRPAEDLQSLFYAASEAAETGSETRTTTNTRVNSSDHQYRDISINVLIRTPTGVPFVCEIQVTLSNLAILKHADQKLYTVRRMKSPMELASARVFYKGALGTSSEGSAQLLW